MTSKQKTTAAVLLILLFCNLGFIWGNSLVSRADSHDLSLNVLHILPGFLQSIIPGEASLLHLVRKAAHFTEFACLGGLSAGLLAVFQKVLFHPVVHLFFGGFFVAALDETIQIFSNRGSQLQDVWLDFAGFSTGLFLVLLVRAILCYRQKSKKQSTASHKVIPFPQEAVLKKDSVR